MARQLTCNCGETLTAQNDEELFRAGKQHIAQKHPDMQMSDEQIRGMVAQMAKDA